VPGLEYLALVVRLQLPGQAPVVVQDLHLIHPASAPFLLIEFAVPTYTAVLSERFIVSGRFGHDG
jgi:hypothetical protein